MNEFSKNLVVTWFLCSVITCVSVIGLRGFLVSSSQHAPPEVSEKVMRAVNSYKKMKEAKTEGDLSTWLEGPEGVNPFEVMETLSDAYVDER